VEVHQKHTIRRHYKIVVTHNEVKKSSKSAQQGNIEEHQKAQQGAIEEQ